MTSSTATPTASARCTSCAWRSRAKAYSSPASSATSICSSASQARAGDELTVLDISLAANAQDLARLLAAGARCRYFDHHAPGTIPRHPGLEALHRHLAAGVHQPARRPLSRRAPAAVGGRGGVWRQPAGARRARGRAVRTGGERSRPPARAGRGAQLQRLRRDHRRSALPSGRAVRDAQALCRSASTSSTASRSSRCCATPVSTISTGRCGARPELSTAQGAIFVLPGRRLEPARAR